MALDAVTSRQREKEQEPFVLVVEDDDDIQVLITAALQSKGFRVVSASNGMEALSLLQSGSRPCLILVDQMMPFIDPVTIKPGD